MMTELGYVSFDYVWVNGRYYRRRLFGLPRWETFDGEWRSVACPPFEPAST
jgi:hypothetical protein